MRNPSLLATLYKYRHEYEEEEEDDDEYQDMS